MPDSRMKLGDEIITVGLSPSWDTVFQFDRIEWGDHKPARSVDSRPAGKAMNISRALAWLGRPNTAAGLWGRHDYELMRKAVRRSAGLVKVRCTAVEGATRHNVTVVDTANRREMHLRSSCRLVSPGALRKLHLDLRALIKRGSVCVFAGRMPEGRLLQQAVRIVEDCTVRGARVAVDTYGQALRRIVETGRVWLINPNVAELRELVGADVADRPASLAKAARRLLDRVEIVLISRGGKGAVVVTGAEAWQGRCLGRGKVLSTVGCGDYLLAGFLNGLAESSKVFSALKMALKAGTAKAWGWPEEKTWAQVRRRIRVQANRL